MSLVLVISETPSRADSYALALADSGLEVEVLTNIDTARDRLGETPAHLVIVDVTSPDAPPGLFVGQAKVAWPDSTVVALTGPVNMACSAVKRMGLWTPDVELRHPVGPARLVAEARALLGRLAGAGCE